MGTKGKDILIWLMLAGIFAAGVVLFYPDRMVKQLVLYYNSILLGIAAVHFIEIYCAKKQSKKLGLEVVVLVPLIPGWGNFLSRRYLRARSVRAYEIHIKDTPKKPRELVRAMERDLFYIEKNTQGLFLWETNIKPPHRIRKIIEKYKAKKAAVWEEGYLLIPKPPLTGKKKLKRGVILIE